MSEKVIVIRLDAGNDRNGNPRRIFVIFDLNGDIIDAIDEEYVGSACVRQKYPRSAWDGSFVTFATTVQEYKDTLACQARREKLAKAAK